MPIVQPEDLPVPRSGHRVRGKHQELVNLAQEDLSLHLRQVVAARHRLLCKRVQRNLSPACPTFLRETTPEMVLSHTESHGFQQPENRVHGLWFEFTQNPAAI